MAIPPALGIGLVCIFLSDGISTMPKFTANLPTKGVIISDKVSDRTNMVIMVVIED